MSETGNDLAPAGDSGRVDGSQQTYRVSGEPMFTQACRFIGYRGIGVEVTARK